MSPNNTVLEHVCFTTDPNRNSFDGKHPDHLENAATTE